MRAFKDDSLSLPEIIQHQMADIIDKWRHPPTIIAIGLEDFFPVDRRRIVQAGQNFIALSHDVGDALLKLVFVQKISHANGGRSLHLVGIGWADAAARRSNPASLGTLLAGGIFLLVIRHHKVSLVANA